MLLTSTRFNFSIESWFEDTLSDGGLAGSGGDSFVDVDLFPAHGFVDLRDH